MTIRKSWALKLWQARSNFENISDRRNICRDRGVDVLSGECDDCYISRSLCDSGEIFCDHEL